ncbi:MAG: LacI family DNA-binding transcriptional regulator [Monoglobus pectinilyticus]
MNPKMKDIASRANVSVSTVSKIINKETKNFRKETVDRVQKIIKEMGYAPNIVARSMVTKKTGLIGLILPDISNLYFAEMAKGIEIALRHMEYNMILCNCNDSDEREKAYIDIMRQKCVDGIILIPVLSSSVDITYTTILKGIPFVILDRIFSK